MFTNSKMNYQATIDYLFNALPAYQNQGESAYKDNLDNTHALMDALGHPENKFKSIHVAGTNGKGSVSHALAAIFQACGYKTGLYTSPHLLDFRERVRINGKMVSEDFVIDFVEEHKNNFETIRPSFFEMTVAMAFDAFAKEKVDIAIIETGMGGRLDSTNVVTPEASVITNISRDHAQFLGNTLEKIAGEKAGIIKEKTPVIIGDMNPSLMAVFSAKAEEENAPLTASAQVCKVVTQKQKGVVNSITYNLAGKYFNLQTDLCGNYQANNIATTLVTIDVINRQGKFDIPFETTKKALAKVMKSTGLRGRWEIIKRRPLWITDTGHNVDGVSYLVQQIAALPHPKKHIIYGCVRDKEVDDILCLFDPSWDFHLTQSSNIRSLDTKKLMKHSEKYKLNTTEHTTVKDAITHLQSTISEEDAVVICGSTFLVADALEAFKD